MIAAPQTAAVIGTGTMGPPLALAFALHGYEARIVGRREDGLAGARVACTRAYDELVEADLAPRSAAGWEDRLSYGRDIGAAVAGADIVIEAIAEDLSQKQALFRLLDEAAPERAVLASTTSGLAVDEIAARSSRRQRILVAHFANPPHLMPAVEMVPGRATAPETMARACAHVERAGKVAIRLRRDVPGHLFNRLQYALMREAFALVRDGIAAPEDVDRVVKLGYALRLAAEGPLEKADLAGLPLVLSVARYLFPALDASQRPDLLERLVAEGRTGAAAGRGLYDWGARDAESVLRARNQEIIRHLKRLRAEGRISR